MIKVTKYFPGDVFLVKPRDVYSDTEDFDYDDKLAQKPNSSAFTFWLGDTPLAVIGLVEYWPGVAEGWAVISDKVKEAPISFHRRVMVGLRVHVKTMKLKRIHAFVRRDFCTGQKWLQYMGFEREGVLKKYGPKGHDYEVWAWLKEAV